jgi:hypothetical protein
MTDVYLGGACNPTTWQQDIDGHEITGRELRDLNNARQYLADVVRRHGVCVFSTVEDAVESIVSLFGSKEC